MDSTVPHTSVAIPEIVITQPSPIINPSVSSVAFEGKTAPIREEYKDESPSTRERTITGDAPQEPSASLSDSQDVSSGEFTPAEVCSDCVVPVPPEQPESSQTEPAPSTESTESDIEEFRTSRCCAFDGGLPGLYECVWNKLESRNAIAFWLIATASPLSAGIMGAIYMFSCPAADSLPNMIFMIGISLMAVLTLRVCIILHRITWEEENSRSMLQTLNLICLFITGLFYITETVAFWQMKSSGHHGAGNFCHPTFYSYAFWWNIATSVLMIVIWMFPIA